MTLAQCDEATSEVVVIEEIGEEEDGDFGAADAQDVPRVSPLIHFRGQELLRPPQLIGTRQACLQFPMLRVLCKSYPSPSNLSKRSVSE